MRQHPGGAGLPGRSRSGSSPPRGRPGRRLPWQGSEVVVEDAAAGRPDRAGHRAVLGRRHHVAGAVAAVRGRRRDRRSTTPRPGGWIPSVPLVVSEVNPEAALTRDRRAAAGASSPTRTAPPWPRCRCSSRCTTRPGCAGWSSPPSRRCPAAGWTASPSWTARSAPWSSGRRRALTHDGSAVEFPAPKKYVRPIAFNVIAAGRQPRRRRLGRDRRGTEAAQRVPQDPRHPGPAGLRHLRAGAGVQRALAVHQRRVRPSR